MNPEEFAESLAAKTREAISQTVAPLKKRIADLEAAVPQYMGTFEPKSYRKGSMVTHGGSLWIAKEQTSQVPGGGNPGWQLAVKAGAPGPAGPKGDKGEAGPRGRDLLP